MKKFYLSALVLGISARLMAQSMNENFDAYSAGSYMGNNSAQWSTWSGTTGGAEDVQVTTAAAFSGSNSIYFSSTSSSGGPQDVIVSFGGEHNTGQFLFESKFFVQTNKGAYFNFQGNATVGQVWALNVQMVQNGDLVVDDANGNTLTGTYPTNQWFTLTIDVNLNTNEWEVFVDGVSQGVLQTNYNQLASIDIYPVNSANGGNNNSGFYIDDFTYDYTPYTLPAVNGAVTAIAGTNGIVGIQIHPTITVRNLGTSAITSFDLTMDYNGNQYTQNITGVNIASLATYDVEFTTGIPLVAGSNPVVATISNVNGNVTDGDATDDSKTVMANPPVPANGKVVVAEEGTGTWCQWCPRGAVFMDMMSEKYAGYFAPVAVHNNDPMTNDNYDAAIGSLIGGYPSALVDRLPEIDPSAIEADFMDRIVIAPKAIMSATANYTALTNTLEVTVTADFQVATTGAYKLACILTEDAVTGSGSGWSQSNAYSGGANGEMGGFELLSNPVPASQMVYDHVAREILPSFNGQGGVIPATVSAGATYSYTFTFTLDPTWDIAELNIIPLLIDPSGDIDNAGFYPFSSLVGIEENSSPAIGLSVYPNPASDIATLQLINLQGENVSVEIIDLNGKVVAARDYQNLNGDQLVHLNTAELTNGIYMVHVIAGDQIMTEKLVIQN